MPALDTDVLDRLRIELAAVRPDLAATASPDATLKHDLEIDSLDVLEFVARVEAAFGVVVPDEDWQAVATLDTLAAYVAAHRAVP